MLQTVHYPREIIAERVAFTPAAHARIALCRGAHNRLGFGYQMGFVRLTGRFPRQQPLEMLDACSPLWRASSLLGSATQVMLLLRPS